MDGELVTSEVFLVGQIAIVIVALFLIGLSVQAWINTRLRKMIFLIVAFGLFAFTHVTTYVDEAVVNIMPDDIRYAMFAITNVVIMLMFVLAVLKK